MLKGVKRGVLAVGEHSVGEGSQSRGDGGLKPGFDRDVLRHEPTDAAELRPDEGTRAVFLVDREREGRVARGEGVALALDVPVAGVTSLEAMAAAAFAGGAASPGDLLVALIDAKKGEVFLAAFDGPEAAPAMPPRHLPRDAAFDVVAALAAGRALSVDVAVAQAIAWIDEPDT